MLVERECLQIIKIFIKNNSFNDACCYTDKFLRAFRLSPSFNGKGLETFERDFEVEEVERLVDFLKTQN